MAFSKTPSVRPAVWLLNEALAIFKIAQDRRKKSGSIAVCILQQTRFFNLFWIFVLPVNPFHVFSHIAEVRANYRIIQEMSHAPLRLKPSFDKQFQPTAPCHPIDRYLTAYISHPGQSCSWRNVRRRSGNSTQECILR